MTDAKVKSPLLIKRLAEKFGVDSEKLLETLKATAFKQRDNSPITNEQMMVLLVVAEQYDLNPFTREIYAYPDKNNGIVPVIGVDGWIRIVNSHPQYAGMEFVYSDATLTPDGTTIAAHEWIECVMYRQDLAQPIRIREYLDEVYRGPFKVKDKNTKASYTVDGPWQSHPKRMHRHKAMIQCARVAFGFSGIYDQDEAERIIDMGSATVVDRESPGPVTAPVQQINHDKIDPLLDKLINRATTEMAWEPAQHYINQRFQGAEAEYALNRLEEAQQRQTTVQTAEQVSNQEGLGFVNDVPGADESEPAFY